MQFVVNHLAFIVIATPIILAWHLFRTRHERARDKALMEEDRLRREQAFRTARIAGCLEEKPEPVLPRQAVLDHLWPFSTRKR